ncbi:MAG: AAA family ATPase, partial [Lachnospirales bacterium]
MSYIITIGREYGSGGRIIGESLAHQLGINYYDDKLIELTAQESGLSTEAVSRFESQRTSSFLYNAYMSTKATTLSDDIFLAQSRVIEELGRKESCVIVSHCADYVLRNNKNV